jgi:hypothetical protein
VDICELSICYYFIDHLVVVTCFARGVKLKFVFVAELVAMKWMDMFIMLLRNLRY